MRFKKREGVDFVEVRRKGVPAKSPGPYGNEARGWEHETERGRKSEGNERDQGR